MQDFFTASLFSLELVNYIIIDDNNHPTGLDIEPHLQRMGEPFFKSIVGDAVRTIIESHDDYLYQKYKEFKKMNVQNFEIVKWTMVCSHLYFQHGYNPESFFLFCGWVVGLAELFFIRKSPDMARDLCDPLASVICAFLFTKEFEQQGGWNGLYEYATEVVKNYEGANTKYV